MDGWNYGSWEWNRMQEVHAAVGEIFAGQSADGKSQNLDVNYASFVPRTGATSSFCWLKILPSREGVLTFGAEHCPFERAQDIYVPSWFGMIAFGFAKLAITEVKLTETNILGRRWDDSVMPLVDIKHVASTPHHFPYP